MVCIICIAAAAAVGAAILGPDVMKDMFQKLKSVVPDARQTAESDSVTKWEGTYQFRRSGSAPTPVPVAVYVYRGQKRLRIQLRTHALSRDESEHVQDTLASAMGAKIVARNIPDAAHDDEDALPPADDDRWVGEPTPQPDLRNRAS